ncbi:cohesin domain-containing protein [Acetivibrio clariflavus]|uniref:cohesin domain-containing protein n=1 Tax=Acetivibrio clariflavus TaxID=288965 RepID=UPI000E3D62F8
MCKRRKKAGSIVINPSINFAINKEKDGIIRILFLDDTLLNEYISKRRSICKYHI